jgi:hypothetical protein
MEPLSAAEIASMVGEVNALANATLIEIAAPGPLAPNGDPGTPVVTWAGEAPGMLDRTQHEGTIGERERQNKHVTFKVYDEVAPSIEIAGAVHGASTVVIEDRSGPAPVTSRWTVKGTERTAENTLDNIVLELDGEATP